MCIAHSCLRCASSLRGAEGRAESCLEEGLSTNSGCLHSGVYLGRVAPELPRRRKPYCFPSALAACLRVAPFKRRERGRKRIHLLPPSWEAAVRGHLLKNRLSGCGAWEAQALLCSICQFPRCKYHHCSRFLATNVRSRNAGSCRLTQTASFTCSD